MAKELTYRLFVTINGEEVPWNSLSPEEKKKISIELNDRAMRSIGLRPVKPKDETA